MTLDIRHRRDLPLALALMGWIGVVLVTDAWLAPDHHPLLRQVLLGLATWLVLAGALARETGLVRTQTMLVVAMATVIEYTFSPVLHAYVYRIETVPFFVPPGHGLVYLAALLIGRSTWLRAHVRAAVTVVVVAGSAWALAGLLGLLPALGPAGGQRYDVLGAFWFVCLLGFLRWGPNRLLYVGAFVVVSYLEITGTALGTWAWASSDPVLHRIGAGNPPSGAAGGYGWFDLWATLLAPRILALVNGFRPMVSWRGRRPGVLLAASPSADPAGWRRGRGAASPPSSPNS